MFDFAGPKAGASSAHSKASGDPGSAGDGFPSFVSQAPRGMHGVRLRREEPANRLRTASHAPPKALECGACSRFGSRTQSVAAPLCNPKPREFEPGQKCRSRDETHLGWSPRSTRELHRFPENSAITPAIRVARQRRVRPLARAYETLSAPNDRNLANQSTRDGPRTRRVRRSSSLPGGPP